MSEPTITRAWAMPNGRTFSIKPIHEFIMRRLPTDGNAVIIDPFARNSTIATITNDISTDTDAMYHMDALEFLRTFDDESVDMVLYDPPYSPRQLKEVYDGMGKSLTSKDTSAAFWSNQKREIGRIVKSGGTVLSFGWNSGGIGRKYGFDIESILLVAHGGQHNDTICVHDIKR